MKVDLKRIANYRMKKYPDALTVDQVAKITGYATKTIYKSLVRGELQAVMVRREYRLPKEELIKTLREMNR